MNRLLNVGLSTMLVALAMVTVSRTNWASFGYLLPRAPAPGPSLPRDPVEIKGQMRGQVEGAKVAVVEFADFQCPYCRTFARDVQPTLMKEYVDAGLVTWSFRHLPLASIHPEARSAAELAECAGAQGHFWRVHDAFFSAWNGDPLTAETLRTLGLEIPQIPSCAARSRETVDRDVRDAEALGIAGTPTFLIGPVKNGRLVVEEIIVGNSTIEQFRKALDSRLSSGEVAASPVRTDN